MPGARRRPLPCRCAADTWESGPQRRFRTAGTGRGGGSAKPRPSGGACVCSAGRDLHTSVPRPESHACTLSVPDRGMRTPAPHTDTPRPAGEGGRDSCGPHCVGRRLARSRGEGRVLTEEGSAWPAESHCFIGARLRDSPWRALCSAPDEEAAKPSPCDLPVRSQEPTHAVPA